MKIFYLDSHSSCQKKTMEHLMSRNFNGKNSDYRTWMMHAHQSQPLEF
jgi:hypothetical protein